MSNWPDAVELLQDHCHQRFGEDVTYDPHDGAPVTVEGVFRAAGITAEAGNEVGIADERPEIDFRLAELVAKGINRAPEEADRITIAGQVYRPEDPVPDGEGIVTLHLLEVPSP